MKIVIFFNGSIRFEPERGRILWSLELARQALFQTERSLEAWTTKVVEALGQALAAKLSLEVVRDRLRAPARPVVTYAEIEAMGPNDDGLLLHFRGSVAASDGLLLFAYPEPGTMLVAHARYDRRVPLSTRDRRLLAQLALHLEAAFRVQVRPASLIGALREDGQIVDSRTKLDGPQTWERIACGDIGLAPRFTTSAREFLLIETAPELRSFRALATEERDVVLRAACGVTTKTIAYDLRLSPSAVSKRLEAAAHKIGIASRTDLVRLCAALHRPRASDRPPVALTTAEDDVLQLLQQGLTNIEIAQLRTRSVRTVANQVAAVLRKTKSSSRRALLVGASDRG